MEWLLPLLYPWDCTSQAWCSQNLSADSPSLSTGGDLSLGGDHLAWRAGAVPVTGLAPPG